MDDQTTRIRALNDAARTSLIGCRVMITQGIQAQDNVAAVLDRVRAFDAYSEDNDPYGVTDRSVPPCLFCDRVRLRLRLG